MCVSQAFLGPPSLALLPSKTRYPRYESRLALVEVSVKLTYSVIEQICVNRWLTQIQQRGSPHGKTDIMGFQKVREHYIVYYIVNIINAQKSGRNHVFI